MKKRTIILLCALGGVLIWSGWFLYSFALGTKVMSKLSPDGKRTAVLRRMDGIDVNFKIYLNGTKIYWSPDFAPSLMDFREHIYWDKESEIIIFEVAGVRLFGYSATRMKELSEDELRAVQTATLQDLRYEGKLPVERK